MKLNRYNALISSKNIIEKSITYTQTKYRPYDPGLFLYNLVLESAKDNFTNKSIELVYTTLIAWNMNTRKASLSNFKSFKESILKNKHLILSLLQFRIENLTENDKYTVLSILNQLFNKLDLTQTKSRLVTFSKTMHFFLPNLVVPIDRKYTLNFFYNGTNINLNHEFRYFKDSFEKFIELAQKVDFDQYYDKKWNRNIPKMIDNTIIGFMSNFV